MAPDILLICQVSSGGCEASIGAFPVRVSGDFGGFESVINSGIAAASGQIRDGASTIVSENRRLALCDGNSFPRISLNNDINFAGFTCDQTMDRGPGPYQDFRRGEGG